MTQTLTALAEILEDISRRYAETFSIERDGDWFALKLQEEVGELTAAWLRATSRSRRASDDDENFQNLGDEIADVIGHALLMARHNGIDIDAAIARKWLVYQAREQQP
ncbi:pyrophosphatase [Rhizobium puerariae]|uniref:Pyrophosphatase n=1 Tax=Rhizobium puerariae TaxID=1585791 RepID=A0ABV6AI59_9HYPH